MRKPTSPRRLSWLATAGLVLSLSAHAADPRTAPNTSSAASAASAVADEPWEQISNDDGIRVWRKEIEGSPVVAFKGVGLIDAPIAKVASVLRDTSRKTEWVANAEEAKDVRQLNEFERIEYNHTGTPFVLKDRDFVFHAKAEFDKPNQQVVIRLKSVEDPAMPETSYVRGKLLASSYILKSVEAGAKTLVTVEIHADPMGSVAKWIVNLFQKSWPRKTLEGIRKQAAKADVPQDALTKKMLGL